MVFVKIQQHCMKDPVLIWLKRKLAAAKFELPVNFELSCLSQQDWEFLAAQCAPVMIGSIFSRFSPDSGIGVPGKN